MFTILALYLKNGEHVISIITHYDEFYLCSLMSIILHDKEHISLFSIFW